MKNNIQNIFRRREIRPKKEIFSYFKEALSQDDTSVDTEIKYTIQKQIKLKEKEIIDPATRLNNLNTKKLELTNIISDHLENLNSQTDYSFDKLKKNFLIIEHKNNGDYSNTHEIILTNKDYNINIFFYDK